MDKGILEVFSPAERDTLLRLTRDFYKTILLHHMRAILAAENYALVVTIDVRKSD
jgi:hypothetical protein